MNPFKFVVIIAALTALVLTNSCQDSPRHVDEAALQPDGKWRSEQELMAGTGVAQVTIEFQENGNCNVSMLVQHVKTAMSFEFVTRSELKGKWHMKNGEIETTLKILSWDNTHPNGEVSKQEFDNYDVVWKWNFDGTTLKHEKYDLLLWSLEKYKGQEISLSRTEGAEILCDLGEFIRLD